MTTAVTACDIAAEYLSAGGHWEPAPPGQTQACSVSLHPRATRWICKSRAKHWRPRSIRSQCVHGLAEGKRLQPQELLPSPQNATWWFVGDSTALSHAQAVACALPRVSRPDGTKAPTWTSPSFSLMLDVRHRLLPQTTCLHLPYSRRVCYIPAGARPHKTKTSVSWAVGRLFVLNLTNAADVLVLNAGAWYLGHGDAAAATHLSDVRSLAQTLFEAAGGRFHGSDTNRYLPRTVWRETFAQHFDTPDGVYSPNVITRNCSRHDDGAAMTKPMLLVKVRDALLAQDVEVLDGWELTRARQDAHTPSRVGDCTHFCIEEAGVAGGVYKALNEAIDLGLRSSCYDLLRGAGPTSTYFGARGGR